MPHYILVSLLILFSPAGLAQETRYVSDEMRISLRSTASERAKVLTTLPSGTALKVLEEQGKYTRVTEPEGKKGWVLKRYLMDQPSARDLLEGMQGELGRLRQDNLQHLETIEKLRITKRDLESRLRHRLSTLEKEHQQLSEENTSLQSSKDREWFLAGAGVLGIGLILGLILPMLRRKPKTGIWQ